MKIDENPLKFIKNHRTSMKIIRKTSKIIENLWQSQKFNENPRKSWKS